MTWQQSVGQQIREARRKVGFTQVRLAEAIGRCRKMIPRYEDGSDAVSPEVLAKIAVALGMTEVNVNGYRFVIQRRDELKIDQTAQQFTLDFDKEHVFEAAVIRITATKTTISITATAPAPTLRPAA